MKTLKKYFRIWWKLAGNNFGTLVATRLSFFSYLSGKIIRFVFFWIFLIALVEKSEVLAGYSPREVLLFYLVFNVIDIFTQTLLRGTYAIGHQLVKEGKFDFILAQPVNPLFRSVSNIIDLIDFATLLPLFPLLGLVTLKLPITPNFSQFVIFLLLTISGLTIAFAFHFLAAGIAVLTFESHHVMFLYRNLLNMVRFPIDIYPQALQFVMTVFVPVGVMVAFPAKALLGLLSWQWVVYSFAVAAVFLFGSLKFWNFSLRHYQSASS
ncbi:MAG: ABC-2 family transporter protein [Candidatus Cloacimonetes bacterium]|nr:ABC-2 family transporter protein [Candidatus Cloacimonadota bacterium]